MGKRIIKLFLFVFMFVLSVNSQNIDVFAVEKECEMSEVETEYFIYGDQDSFSIESLLNRDLKNSSKYEEVQRKTANRRTALKGVNDTPSIVYSGKYGDIEWKIDEYGLLTVTGNGEYKPKNTSAERVNLAPWHKYASDIVTAYVDVKNTSDFSQMFYQCINLQQVTFKPENALMAKNMQGMFAECYSLTSINITSIDTSNVKDMNAMFANCISINTIDLSSADTTLVESMSYMFYGCESLSKIVWSNKCTQKVKYMGVMFAYCWNLKNVYLKEFNCSNVEDGDAGYMFYQCYKLSRVDSPQNLKSTSIDLFNDISLNDSFVWIKEKGGIETNIIPANVEQSAYLKVCKKDYWEKFENRHGDFNRLANYYFITQDDYRRLLSRLSEAERINISGGERAYFYYSLDNNSNITQNPFKPRAWEGSCYGMASWCSLQNNGWVRILGELKEAELDYDIMSKINYYHVQQHLTMNENLVNRIYGLSKGERIQLLKNSMETGELPIIAYEWEEESEDSQVGDGELVGTAHTVCGIALRTVGPSERTNKGVDVSDYTYCMIVYDPSTQEISTHSDYNMYFNDDGTFYIPARGLQNNDNDVTRIKRITSDRAFINGVDYYTGVPSSGVNSDSGKYLRLSTGKEYVLKWSDRQVIIGRYGVIKDRNNKLNIIYEETDEGEKSKTITVCLPDAEEYTISSNDAFEAYMQGDDYTVYANVFGEGSITFRCNGDTYIESKEEVNKTIFMGVNNRTLGNAWNYVYVSSDNGKEIYSSVIGDKLIMEGDNISDAIVRLFDDYDEELNPIVLPQNTTKAEFSKDDEGNVIVEHNGDIIDDGNDEHQIKDGFRASFEITDNWEGGYNALIRIENTSEENIDNWTLTFDYVGEISNVWNAEILSHDGNRYTIKNVGWNQDIAPGQTIEIGLSGQENFVSEPTDYALIIGLNEGNTNDFSVSVQIYDDWGSGCNGNMTITNNSDTTIEDWVLEFDFDAELTSIWNAEIVSHEGAHYIIKNAQHNSNIEPGQSVSVGFNGGEGAGSTELRGYKLYSYGL